MMVVERERQRGSNVAEFECNAAQKGNTHTAKGVIGRDVDAAFVGKDSGFDLPVSEAGTEWEGNILVHGLECL